jgi:outer membrane protein OmpA-like peptidoglycan-associated protein
MKIPFSFLFLGILFSAQSQELKHILYFDSGKSNIGIKDISWIDSLSQSLKTKQYSIHIKAYCDSDGPEEGNMRLSEMRAAAVKQRFIYDKLDSQAIMETAFGERDPAGDNESSAGKALNRRAVISYTILDKIQPQKSEEDIPAPPVVKSNSVLPEKSIADEKLEVGKTLILKNLNFEGGTAILLEQSEPVLKDLLKLIQENPSLVIEIGGHVCCGPDYELSLLRAKRVYNYLKGYGIDEKRMSYKGYSFDKPIASERTEEGRVANRRVEITILKL